MTHEALSSKLRDTLLESGNPAYDDDRNRRNGIGVLAKIWQAYVSYRSDRAYRQPISKLSDHLLADIGITLQEANELDSRTARH